MQYSGKLLPIFTINNTYLYSLISGAPDCHVVKEVQHKYVLRIQQHIAPDVNQNPATHP